MNLREGEIRTREEGTFADVRGTDNEDAGPLLRRFPFSDYLLIHLLLLLLQIWILLCSNYTDQKYNLFISQFNNSPVLALAFTTRGTSRDTDLNYACIPPSLLLNSLVCALISFTSIFINTNG